MLQIQKQKISDFRIPATMFDKIFKMIFMYDKNTLHITRIVFRILRLKIVHETEPGGHTRR